MNNNFTVYINKDKYIIETNLDLTYTELKSAFDKLVKEGKLQNNPMLEKNWENKIQIVSDIATITNQNK